MDLTKLAGPKTDFTEKFADLFTAEHGVAQRVSVPKLTYISIEGVGRPSKENTAFMDGCKFLSGIAFSLKFRLKRMEQEGFKDYEMPPVQGLRSKIDKDPTKQERQLQLLQPGMVTQPMVTKMVEIARMKEQKKILSTVTVSARKEGDAIQTLHRGPYENILESVALLQEEAKKAGCKLTGRHHEIYLNDSRRTRPDYLETIVRYQVVKG